MPIQLNWTNPSGSPHPSSYWVVELITFDAKLNQKRIRVNGYHDSNTFNAADPPVTYREYTIDTPVNYSLTVQQALDNLYTFLLADAFFVGGSLV